MVSHFEVAYFARFISSTTVDRLTFLHFQDRLFRFHIPSLHRITQQQTTTTKLRRIITINNKNIPHHHCHQKGNQPNFCRSKRETEEYKSCQNQFSSSFEFTQRCESCQSRSSLCLLLLYTVCTEEYYPPSQLSTVEAGSILRNRPVKGERSRESVTG